MFIGFQHDGQEGSNRFCYDRLLGGLTDIDTVEDDKPSHYPTSCVHEHRQVSFIDIEET